MDLQVENLDTHEARITITIPDDVVAQARRDVARKLSKQIRIAGFRPGMAPVSVVVNAVGEQAFANELADELGGKYYSQAIDESKIDPYGPGQLEDVKSSPTQLVVKVPLEPTVDLKDYKAIRVPYVPPIITDEEVNSQLEYIRDDNAVVELVERPAQLGDLVEADIEVEAEGKEVLHSHRPVVLEDARIGLPGLADAIVGMSAGEHKDVTVTLPDDTPDETLRGKEATALIDVKRVSSRLLPEINDELVQTVGSFNTLAELREDLYNRLMEYRARRAMQQYQTQVLDTFTSLSEVAYPLIYVEERLTELVEELKDDVRRDEHMPFEEWLKVQSKTEQQVRDELRPNAENRARRGLVMRQVALAENIQVTDEEIAAEVERTISQYGGSNNAELRRSMMKEENRRTVQNTILTNKVLSRMAQIALGDSGEAGDAGDAGETSAESALTPEPAQSEPASAE
ncbi:MAG: trigger factor [Chloroflexi bacterium]|nr:trigger factor [Chloroflexota bacterium]MCL5274727.1 trigger factor [Chloroflexota bacterium]